MNNFYTDNKNQQILIALLKAHNIRYVVASPGGTNPALLVSFQYDGFFEMFSCVDERSAAYMACGIAAQTGEPVILCCTGATASRNYFPALTEAFYRKLPIITITCSRPSSYIGQLFPQVTDRNSYNKDTFVCGELLQVIKDADDFSNCEVKINRAILALKRNGGGPVHLNVECITQSCNTEQLPSVHITRYVNYTDSFPSLPCGRIGIFIGSHNDMSAKLQQAIEQFCRNHNAVVFSDHTSGYYGDFRIQYALIGSQSVRHIPLNEVDLLIHIGEISGDYPSMETLKGKSVWRVSKDGELRVRFGFLDYLFHMDEFTFFNTYKEINIQKNEYYNACKDMYDTLIDAIPELPLCHIYAARKLAPIIPDGSILHFAILNALRSWNFFQIKGVNVRTNCNVGGFGIDGCTSSLLGASFVEPQKTCFLFTGDLAFFYDLNSLGNRHIGPNVRILLMNDGKGAEFRHFQWPEYGQNLDMFVAGSGHFGHQSKLLVRNLAENLGFEYISATSEEEFDAQIERFVSAKKQTKPILFEVFSTTENQSIAWKSLTALAKESIQESFKCKAKNLVGTKLYSLASKIKNKS